MEPDKKSTNESNLERQLQEFITETPKTKKLKTVMIFRIIGFSLIVGAFVLAMLARQGIIGGSALNTVTSIMIGTGFVVYLGSRLYDITKQIREKKK